MADLRSRVGWGERPGGLVEFQPARQCYIHGYGPGSTISRHIYIVCTYMYVYMYMYIHCSCTACTVYTM